MVDQPTAAELAQGDQIIAAASDQLNLLIDAHRTVTATERYHPQVQLSSLAAYLIKDYDLATIVDLLTVAVDRLTQVKQDGTSTSSKPGGTS